MRAEECSIKGLKQKSNESMRNGNLSDAVKLYNQAWDKEREATNMPAQEKTINELKAEIEKLESVVSHYERQQKADREQYDAALHESRTDYFKMRILWRLHLDEAPIQEDDDWEKEARQVLWNDSDKEKQIEAEGYKP